MPESYGAGTPTATYTLSKSPSDDASPSVVSHQALSSTGAVIVAPRTSKAVSTFRLNLVAPVKPEARADGVTLIQRPLGQQQHILVRTADVSQWVGALQAQARHPWRPAKASKAKVRHSHQQQQYRWYDSISSNLVLRGRDGRTLVQRSPAQAIAPHTANSIADVRPAALPSITTQPPATDSSDTMRCRRAELGYPRSNPELSVECRMRLSSSCHNIPAQAHDPAEQRLVVTPQSAPSTRCRKVSFNEIVLTADVSSRDEYERAGPDMFAQYKKLPREERMKVNQEIDRCAHLAVPMRGVSSA